MIIIINILALNERKRLMAIREEIPSVTNALIKLHENLEDRKLSKYTQSSNKFKQLAIFVYLKYSARIGYPS